MKGTVFENTQLPDNVSDRLVVDIIRSGRLQQHASLRLIILIRCRGDISV